MKTKQYISFLLLIAMTAIFLNACAPTTTSPEVQYVVVTATVAPITSTPDPCGAESIEAEVQKVHTYMRQFDDASSLAASRPQGELGDAIAELQKIRRETEDQPTPPCLTTLRTYQVSHMNSVINTLIGFMGGSDQATVDQGIAQARDLHDKYTLELARLLGVTVEPAVAAPSQTPSP
ncbi:MAG: hypothetical protein IPP66_20595 [Anaerolineales bacterium]|nr:hypothetical protein [Anaerolineales bacterium]